ncbi:MAG: hypothetical protein IKI09_01725 [Bacteroidales bacterium]|nr:hypothetical protein [Bacteroidales bacterium]
MSEGRAKGKLKRRGQFYYTRKVQNQIATFQKKVIEGCTELEHRKPTFFAEPKERHQVKWHPMTITITKDLRPHFSFSSHFTPRLQGKQND